ncbi:hypothetical protein P3X46_029235 [Hevea brasiliensis]|uniref:Radical SAM core domain-containing protein n=1 Tax=Hevea brasiliensis TaxID=3981 RepID=A0ABQ9KUI6_HEVBR|nr:hypothetical protein P3X46_029235 [Hevea brasiliensis]
MKKNSVNPLHPRFSSSEDLFSPLISPSLPHRSLKILSRCFFFGIRFISSNDPQPYNSHCYGHFAHRTLKRKSFSLHLFRRLFHSHHSLSNQTHGPSLYHCCPNAYPDKAEQKVWRRQNYVWFLKRHWKSSVAIGRSQSLSPPKVVVLGCMAERLKDKILDADKMVDVVLSNWKFSEGFSSSMCKVEKVGLRFSDLLDWIGFPLNFLRCDYLLYVMRDRYKICKYIHLPVQTGSSTVLGRMRWGYTREAYLDLVQKIRRIMPDVGISSDVICGFCGETEEEHKDTISLIRAVGYDMAYMFAYSMKKKIHAHGNYVDDIGTIQLLLVEGLNKRADTELIGKSDRGERVLFANLPVPNRDVDLNNKWNPVIGDFVEVHILKSTQALLFGERLLLLN